ncbi:MAG: threonine synthase [Thermovirgaceae bacterium]|nr:threonine synthase [Thermovirgaceae bacterium]
MLKFFCPKCGKICEEVRRPVSCGCGSPLKSSLDWASFDIDPSAVGMWRYSRILPEIDPSISMGEGWTPLITGGSKNLFYKLEYVSPTGSFKDRGSVIVMGEAKSLGCDEVVQDSSGNAGASIAAYAARSGIKATVIVPNDTPELKKRQIELFGATLVVAEGGRSSAASIAKEMARTMFYASHVWNPLFLEGTRTIAFEIWEQLGGKAPDVVIVPAGNGTILLGIFKGFMELLQRVKINRLPRIIAVQGVNCAPLFAAWKGSHSWDTFQTTVAEGIAVSDPPRMKEMLDAVRMSRGEVVIVSNGAILAEEKRLALEGGLLVEPTSAAAPAAERMLRESGAITDREIVVVPLTGTGLKKFPKKA